MALHQLSTGSEFTGEKFRAVSITLSDKFRRVCGVLGLFLSGVVRSLREQLGDLFSDIPSVQHESTCLEDKLFGERLGELWNKPVRAAELFTSLQHLFDLL